MADRIGIFEDIHPEIKNRGAVYKDTYIFGQTVYLDGLYREVGKTSQSFGNPQRHDVYNAGGARIGETHERLWGNEHVTFGPAPSPSSFHTGRPTHPSQQNTDNWQPSSGTKTTH